ncbi:hypothetical protein AVEN_160256-1 [Araneus ventricosus]|uniref:Uncharacterized protein n=1 Tax=Araneus ventricosus TaxID=182803 RepID=A0A4Y2RVZ0_ARAVE|nr:hypothetical protein AVEN_160256-1 [Araneus ventricosus]
MEFSCIFKRIPFPNRDIEKSVAFSGIIYFLQGQGTFNSTQLTSFLAHSADEIPKSFYRLTHTTQYRSASSNLLARTADRTPKRDSKDIRMSRRS